MKLIADNLQPLNHRFFRALERRDPAPIQQLVRICESAGADFIDLNTGPLKRDPIQTMDFLVRVVQEASDLPIWIDTANPIAIQAGLAANTKTAVINGISLEPAKLRDILPLAVRYEVDTVGFLLLPDGGVPANALERIQAAIELHEVCRQAGFPATRLIMDPILVPVMWNNGLIQNREILSVIRQLPEILDNPIRSVVGLSNVTAGEKSLYRKQLLECTVIPMLASSGLEMLMMNMMHSASVHTARISRIWMERDLFCWEEIDPSGVSPTGAPEDVNSKSGHGPPSDRC
jgi:5-methyltetrahydrofolate corrinoid/iron sulfur protein methyltransferase